MLRRTARQSQAKLIDVAEVVVKGHRLLPAVPAPGLRDEANSEGNDS
jgi:hypothetical protein